MAAARPAHAAGAPGPGADPVPAGGDRRLRGRHGLGQRGLAPRRRRRADRARPAALRHHQLPDHRRAGRAAARPARAARAVHARGPGAHRRPDRLPHPSGARTRHGADRDRGELGERGGAARPRRVAAGPGPGAAPGAAPGRPAHLGRGHRRARGARGRRPRPRLGPLRPLHQLGPGARRRNPRSGEPGDEHLRWLGAARHRRTGGRGGRGCPGGRWRPRRSWASSCS